MNKKSLAMRIRTVLALCATVFCLSLPLAQANPMGGQIPQIPAFLPMLPDVPMTKKLPIDGEWMISSNRKRIRIEGGRAYAVDPWVHLFVLKIEPLMVVSKDWRREGKGKYTGEDLPLMGRFTATLQPNGYLSVNVAGALGPVQFNLIPIRADSQRRFDREKGGSSRSDEDDDEYYEDDEEYRDDEEEYSDDDEEYRDDEDEYSDDDEEYYDDEDEYSDDDEEYYDDEDEYSEDDEYYEDEEEEPRKVAAKKHGKAKKGCKGRQIYRSGGSCYECPKGYKRTRLTRKMTHPEACTKRGFGNDKRKAKYKWQVNGCPKGQFKHKGYCKSCPEGTKRQHLAGIDTGYCKIQY